MFTAAELYISDFTRQDFLQLRGNSKGTRLIILTHASNPCIYETRRKQHDLYLSL